MPLLTTSRKYSFLKITLMDSLFHLDAGLPSVRVTRFLASASTDVALFSRFCQFVWIQGEPTALIYNTDHEVYTKQGIDISAIRHLQDAGLIEARTEGYIKRSFRKHTRLFYFGRLTKIQFPQEENNSLEMGCVILTDMGKEIAPFCGAIRNQQFYEYVIGKWSGQGMVLSTILPRV